MKAKRVFPLSDAARYAAHEHVLGRELRLGFQTAGFDNATQDSIDAHVSINNLGINAEL
jgi:hypothetical protein